MGNKLCDSCLAPVDRVGKYYVCKHCGKRWPAEDRPATASDSNVRFLNAYNRLDNYLKSITGSRDNINLVSYLERILPEKQRSELKTIRGYKNSVESHGVNPGNKKPVVPEEWIRWLENELNFCKSHKDQIERKMKNILSSPPPRNEKDSNHPSYPKKQDRPHPILQRPEPETPAINFGISKKTKSFIGGMIEKAVSVENLRNAIKKGGQAKALFDAVAKQNDSMLDPDLISILSEYGGDVSSCRTHNDLVREVTLYEIALLDSDELMKLLGMA